MQEEQTPPTQDTGTDSTPTASAHPASASTAGAPNADKNSPWERDTLERLVMAQINEQRAARRWRIGFRMFWILLVLGVMWFSFYHGRNALGGFSGTATSVQFPPRSSER